MFYTLFKKSLNRAYTKFKLNFFLYKNSLSLKFSHAIHTHLFINIYKQLTIRFFKLPSEAAQMRTFYFFLITNVIIFIIFFTA